MTILNVWTSPLRALLAVDTLTSEATPAATGPSTIRVGPAATPRHVSKLAALPHASTVIAGRGHLLLHNFIFGTSQMGGAQTFDELDASMPSLLERGLQMLERVNSQLQGQQDFSEQQLALVGWSPSREAMTAVLYQQSRASAGFERMDLGGQGEWLCAWHAETQGPSPAASSRVAMATIARAQKAHIEAVMPGQALVGGRLLVAEISRDRLVVDTVCSLDSLGRLGLVPGAISPGAQHG